MTVPLLLALALSFDGLFAGIAYGLRRMTIPIESMAIVAGCTFAGITGSMLLGSLVGDIVSERSTQLLAAIVLGLIGLWQLVQGWLEYVRQELKDGTKTTFRLQVQDLGFVIQVLREPTLADRDLSGRLEAREALLLGIALGLDAFGAGFAAALLAIPAVVLVPLVTLGQPGLTWLGLYIGRRFGGSLHRGKGLLLPGAVLCLLALLQL